MGNGDYPFILSLYIPTVEFLEKKEGLITYSLLSDRLKNIQLRIQFGPNVVKNVVVVVVKIVVVVVVAVV